MPEGVLRHIGLCLILLLLGSCQQSEVVDQADRKLARVQNNYLMASDLAGMALAVDSPADSALMTNAYVERWVREQAMMHQAEKNIPKDLNIDELVRDYRASLVRYHYEQLIVEVELDSTISQEELMTNFNRQADDFKLKERYFKYQMLTIAEDDPNLSKIQDWWKTPEDSTHWQLLTAYCNEAALSFALGREEWISESSLTALLPNNVKTKNLALGKVVEENENGIQYFLKIDDKKEKGEISPFALVKDQIKKVILHRRKIGLLENKIEETYQRESELNNVEIFN